MEVHTRTYEYTCDLHLCALMRMRHRFVPMLCIFFSWSRLSALVGEVLSSPALVAASFSAQDGEGHNFEVTRTRRSQAARIRYNGMS